MDDRFHRRELLLHLGDMLEASSRLARGDARDTPVVRRVREDASLRKFSFLPMLAATMTVSEFCAGAVSAFSRWPAELLEVELNRDALASSVQLNLFGGNRDGWDAYIAGVQKKVPWFGVGLPEVTANVPAEPAGSAVDSATSFESTDKGVSPTGHGLSSEKKGWPWPEAS
jgi:hypothetical protein